ncbi:uncharacterized protein STEHIDRAFT_124553, partial [Stereum hirsutum FP-91666 SS1]|uniref:uncharacterized protein n=1 Tax=Stereum hirsutum (strain FP-91666) TaxID=721885 RepID=UPI0004449BFE
MSDLATQVFQLQAVKYVQVAAMTLLIHDAVICVESEVRLIWSTPWSVPKVLYLISRYSPFVDTILDIYDYLAPHPSPRVCYITYSTSSVLTAVGVAISELILFVRTWALYDRNMKLLYAFSALWIAGFAVVCWAVGTFVKSIVFDHRAPPLDRLSGCYMAVVDPTVFLCFVTLFVVELILVSLTVWKGVKLLRQSHLSPLMKSFYRESIFFYLAIFPLTLGNVIIFLAAPSDLLDLLDTLMRVMHSILCCRILLHLRSAGHTHRRQLAWRRSGSSNNNEHPFSPSSSGSDSRSGVISQDMVYASNLAGDEDGGHSGQRGTVKKVPVRWDRNQSDRAGAQNTGIFGILRGLGHARMDSGGSQAGMLAGAE